MTGRISKLLLLICFPALAFGQNIPDSWIGTWSGDLHIYSPQKGLTKSLRMELNIFPGEQAGSWKWGIVYYLDDGKDERNYKLIEIDRAKGWFEVDEENGIVIPEIVIGNRMFSVFNVGSSVLNSTMTFNKKDIIWEFLSYNVEAIHKSGGLNDIPEVISYFPGTYQKAILKKQKSRH